MADDATRPVIDPALLEEARAKGIDVDTLIDRALRGELAERRSPGEAASHERSARQNAEIVVQSYNQRFASEGAWIEAWRNWQ